MNPFNDLFDFDDDGELNSFEPSAADYAFLSMIAEEEKGKILDDMDFDEFFGFASDFDVEI